MTWNGTDGLRAFGRSPHQPRTVNRRSPLASVLLSFSQSSQPSASLDDSTTPEPDPQDIIIFPQRKQRRPSPDKPRRGIPREQWPDVVRRVEQGESLRRVAKVYGVSYETIRRVLRAMRQEEGE